MMLRWKEKKLRQEQPYEIRRVGRSDELLQLTRENNAMLKWIVAYLQHEWKHDDTQDFLSNIVANIAADRLMGNNI